MYIIYSMLCMIILEFGFNMMIYYRDDQQLNNKAVKYVARGESLLLIMMQVLQLRCDLSYVTLCEVAPA